MSDAPKLPGTVERADFEAALNEVRARETTHTRESDAIAAARRRLPMVEIDASLELVGPDGPLALLDAWRTRTPAGFPGHQRADGRPIPQWSRLAAGHSDSPAG